jgi:hypothetical protein
VSSELTRAVAQLAGGSPTGGPPLSPPETHVPTTGGGTGPKLRGLKPGQGDALLRVVKMRRTSSFGGETKPSAPCNKILRMLKIPTSIKEILRMHNSAAISRQVSPASLLDVCWKLPDSSNG